MRTIAVVTLMASLFAVPAFAGREPSYAEKMACQHMLEFLKDAAEILGKMPLENYTTSVGTRSIEEPITRSKQEMSRCPKGTPDIAVAEERIAKLRAAVAAKTEEAKALAPGAKKVTAAVKVWLGKLEAAKKSEPMAFQNPSHKSVVWLRDDLDGIKEKLLASVRMPKPRRTPEMQKIMKQVIASSDFVQQMKSEGNKVLRVMVIEDKITHTKTTEWYHGRWYTRDFDSFTCLAAMKHSINIKVWKWQFDARFARTELPELKTGVWTYGSWHRFGPILEANVNK